MSSRTSSFLAFGRNPLLTPLLTAPADVFRPDREIADRSHWMSGFCGENAENSCWGSFCARYSWWSLPCTEDIIGQVGGIGDAIQDLGVLILSFCQSTTRGKLPVAGFICCFLLGSGGICQCPSLGGSAWHTTKTKYHDSL